MLFLIRKPYIAKGDCGGFGGIPIQFGTCLTVYLKYDSLMAVRGRQPVLVAMMLPVW